MPVHLTTCRRCGSPFSVPPYRLASAKFCSLQCRRAPETWDETVDRFWSHVDRTGDCWLWIGGLSDNGYGQFTYGQINASAHRFAWALATGVAPASEEDVCHTCDIKRCIRNDGVGTYTVESIVLPRRGHLFLGDNDNNIRDKVQKGRSTAGDRHWSRRYPERVHIGEQHHAAHLTEPLVLEIRARHAAGETIEAIATTVPVTGGTVRDVVTRRSWKHL